MQKSSNCADYKVEFNKALNGELEICYFDNPKGPACVYWRLSNEIVDELILWWKKLQKTNMQLPITEKKIFVNLI